MKVEILLIAKHDVLQVAEKYDQLRPGLGDAVYDELDHKIALLKEQPSIFQRISQNLRRVPIEIVPYQLYYAALPTVVPILGLIPARSDPKRQLKLMRSRLTSWAHDNGT